MHVVVLVLESFSGNISFVSINHLQLQDKKQATKHVN